MALFTINELSTGDVIYLDKDGVKFSKQVLVSPHGDYLINANFTLAENFSAKVSIKLSDVDDVFEFKTIEMDSPDSLVSMKKILDEISDRLENEKEELQSIQVDDSTVMKEKTPLRDQEFVEIKIMVECSRDPTEFVQDYIRPELKGEKISSSSTNPMFHFVIRVPIGSDVQIKLKGTILKISVHGQNGTSVARHMSMPHGIIKDDLICRRKGDVVEVELVLANRSDQHEYIIPVNTVEG